MKRVPLLPGEESLYNWNGGVLEAAEKGPAIKQTLKETAIAADSEAQPAYVKWRPMAARSARAGTRR